MAGAGNLRASYTISDTDRNGKGLPEGYASYSGDVFDGLYSGRGELAFQNGDKYAGMFAGNTMSGQGAATSTLFWTISQCIFKHHAAPPTSRDMRHSGLGAA